MAKRHTAELEEGPGLRILSRRTWYGGGYCGVCGDRGTALVPIQVRWWDCDDGWRVGVLCQPCAADCTDRGPQPGDFAVQTGKASPDRIDVAASMGDEDATYTEGQD